MAQTRTPLAAQEEGQVRRSKARGHHSRGIGRPRESARRSRTAIEPVEPHRRSPRRGQPAAQRRQQQAQEWQAFLTKNPRTITDLNNSHGQQTLASVRERSRSSPVGADSKSAARKRSLEVDLAGEPLPKRQRQRSPEHPAIEYISRSSSGDTHPGDGHPHPPPNKPKLSYPTRLPPEFWDGFEGREIPVTRNALEELNRRNARSSRPLWGLSSHPAPRPVTRRFAALAKDGGPDLSDLRGYPEPSEAVESGMSSSQSSLGRRKRGSALPSMRQGRSNTTSTKSTGPYDRAFQQHLVDFGIYPDGYEYPDGQIPPEPGNMGEILQALGRRRPSLSPSRFTDEDFRKFKRADTHASKEAQVTASVIPVIEGDIGDSRSVAGQIPFTNLDHLTDGSLVPGNPDRYHGARPEQLDRQVRLELDRYIVPSTQKDLPAVPNFFLAVKGPDGTLAVAMRQACYDAGFGARGFQRLQSYAAGEPVFDNKAYVITSIYYGGHLKMYTSHPIPPTTLGARHDYTMTQIKAYALTSDADAFRLGARAYRNGMDWAKLQRDEMIRQANGRVAASTPSLSGHPTLSFASEASADGTVHASQDTVSGAIRDSDASSPYYDSDTSADELSVDWREVKRPRGPDL